MLVVDVYWIEMGKERKAQIIWNGARFVPSKDHGVIRNIINDPIYVPRKDGSTGPIYPNEDPEEFMKRLHIQYRGLCSVSEAREMSVSDELRQLYTGIHNCRRCPSVFPSLVPREVIESAADSGIVLIAQAPSKAGVRKSGRHWVDCDGKLLRPGGVFLDECLRLIGYSVAPSLEGAYERPYTTNVLHCWTGGEGRRDRKPSIEELSNCRPWLLKEFEIIKPKVIILLGKPAADSFACTCGESLSFSELLARQGEIISFGQLALRRFALPHPSAPYPGKSDLYGKVIHQVGNILRT